MMSTQLGADKMPAPPQGGQLCALILSMRQQASNTNVLILSHEGNHGITLGCLKQVVIPIMHILQCRSLEHNVLLIS